MRIVCEIGEVIIWDDEQSYHVFQTPYRNEDTIKTYAISSRDGGIIELYLDHGEIVCNWCYRINNPIKPPSDNTTRGAWHAWANKTRDRVLGC
jgi:hypothetical protein